MGRLSFAIIDEPVRVGAALTTNWADSIKKECLERIDDLNAFCDWLYYYLNIPNIKSKLNTSVEVKFLTRKGSSKVCRGAAFSDNLRTRVEIYVRNNPTVGDLYETIAHEFIHLKQYHYGELLNVNGNHQWVGPDQTKEVLIDKKWKQSYKRYYNLPYELEAKRNQALLSEAWNFKKRLVGKPEIKFDEHLN